MDIKCKTCRWWMGRQAAPNDLGHGECHGAPPTDRGFERYETVIGWPRTRGDDFCGMHTPSLAALEGETVHVVPDDKRDT